MPTVEQFETSEASPDFLTDLRKLLDAAFCDSFSIDDWDHGLGGRHFALFQEAHLVAYCTVVPRTIYVEEKPASCGYLENVASAPDKRHLGLASAVVREANTYIAANFEMGGLSSSKHDFYSKLGWRVWLGPTLVKSGNTWRSSEGENGGIMIFETGSIPNLNLHHRIACEERPGDDW